MEQSSPSIWTLIWSKVKVVGQFFLLIVMGSLPVGLIEHPFGGGTYSLGQTVLALVCLFGVIAFFLWRAKRTGLAIWERSVLSKKGIFLILAVFAVAYANGELCSLWLEHLGQDMTANQKVLEESFRHLPMVYVICSTAIFAPVTEEVLFRGLVMKKLFGHQVWLGLVFSSLLFAWVHGPTNLPSWLIYGVAGFSLGWIYKKTDNLAYPIAVHALNNLISVLIYYFL